MTKAIGPWLTGMCAVAACWAPAAGAVSTVIDFEPQTPALYFPTDSFEQSGFRMTVLDNFAQIDVASAVVVPPSGDASQIYFQAGDGGLKIVRTDGGTFSLDGLSTAFVPLAPAVNEVSALVALGTHPDGTYNVGVYTFAPMSNGARPFASYGAPDASYGPDEGFQNLSDLLLFGCANGAGGICYQPNLGNGQFALDDIRLTPAAVTAAVPEPADVWLLAAGLAALTFFIRHTRVRAGGAAFRRSLS